MGIANNSATELLISRRYHARRELIFRAFTEPSLLARWFSPDSSIINEIIEHSLTVGGQYRFRYRFVDGTHTTVAGQFREIVAPSHLVFTGTWEPPDPHAGIETLVTVRLTAEEHDTVVLVRHEQFPDVVARDRHDIGWQATVARLEELLND